MSEMIFTARALTKTYTSGEVEVHRVHHADTDIDVSTGVRFHPVQMVLSVIVKLESFQD
jgi:hypothetical protein